MESRKIIKFGNSSYVVTLPNDWVKKNKLEKGDFVNLKDCGSSLLINMNKTQKDKTIEINIDDIPLKVFNKKLISYYLKNYKFIKITGSKVIERLEEIRVFKEKLSSIEIYEIGKDFVLFKDLGNHETLNVNDLIEKIVEILKILFDEILEESRHLFIGQIDANINKLTFLTYKKINFNLDNNIDGESRNSIYYWRVVSALETIGDILKRIARYLKNSKADNAHYLKDLIKSVKEYYLFIVGLITSNKPNIDNNLKIYLDKKQSLLKEFEQVRDKFSNNIDLYLVTTQLLKDIIGRIDIIVLSIIDIHTD